MKNVDRFLGFVDDERAVSAIIYKRERERVDG